MHGPQQNLVQPQRQNFAQTIGGLDSSGMSQVSLILSLTEPAEHVAINQNIPSTTAKNDVQLKFILIGFEKIVNNTLGFAQAIK